MYVTHLEVVLGTVGTLLNLEESDRELDEASNRRDDRPVAVAEWWVKVGKRWTAYYAAAC